MRIALAACVLGLVATASFSQSSDICMGREDGPGCADAPLTADGSLKPGTHAYFAGPTDRYPHGVLGDAIEWGRLSFVTISADGVRTETGVRLPEDRVFEDLVPRLADLEPGGAPEVVVVESSAQGGAELAVYGVDGRGVMRKLAATPPIGRSFRWLAPVGVADFDGDGTLDIAYVETPHLGKTLRIWSWRSGRLEEIGRVPGLTNHKIGEDFISGGVRDCGSGPEMITADARWRMVMSTRFEKNALRSDPVGPFAGPESFAAALRCEAAG